MSAADPFGLVGQVLDGQFRVDKLVGEGGFSAVYRGHHQGLNEPIAIKSLKLPPALDVSLVDTFVQRFRDESRILYRLSQGNLHVVRSIAAGTTQAPASGALVPYMVLEWLEGRSVQNDFTVRRTLGQSGRSLDEILKLFETAADGLAYAHAQGVVHRDLNPGNLFLAQTQHGVKMKVLDFGVAKLMHDGALNMGPRQQTVGQIKIFAPAYGAPEQFDDRVGTVGAYSDVYAFALILIEALRDRCVNEGTHIGEFAQSACDPKNRPTPRALGVDVPDEVEAAFARATTLDPKERWQTAGDFWQSLTIASKVATERRYESAARETPPLAMGGPIVGAAAGTPRAQPKDVAIGGKNLARTIPLGATTPGLPRPGPAAPRPRTPTTIGIPAPAVGGRAPSAVAPGAPAAPSAARGSNPAIPAPVVPAGAARTLASPTPGTALKAPVAPPRTASSPRNPALPAVQPLSSKGSTDRPPANANPPATARYPSGHDLPSEASRGDAAYAKTDAGPPPSSRRKGPALPTSAGMAAAAPASNEVVDIPSMDPLPDMEEDEDEATKVHAPAPEILRTLAIHDAASARAQAQAMIARQNAQREPSREATMQGPHAVDPAEEANALEAAARGASTKPGYVDIHAEIPEPPPSGGTLMMAPVAHPLHRAPGGLGSTLAMASPLGPGYSPPGAPHHHAPEPQDWQAPTQALPAMPVQAAPGMQGIPGAHGTPPQGVPAVNLGAMAPPYGQGSAVVSPMMQGNAPFGAAPHHQQPSQQPPGPPFGRQPEHAFPPPSFAQSSIAPAKQALPIVPIAIVLGVLALGGIGLGVFALRARHTTPAVDPAASAMSSDVPPIASLTPVPVPVETAAVPVPVPVPAVVEELDAAPAAPEDAAPAAATATTTATAAPTAPTPPTATTTAAPFGQPPPTPPIAVAVPPPPTPSAKPAADPNAFSESTARSRLGQANGVLAFCKKEGGVTGPGSASVTFALDGSVASVAVDPPYAGTPEGACVSSQFRRAKVPPFTGAPQTVRHTFEVPK